MAIVRCGGDLDRVVEVLGNNAEPVDSTVEVNSNSEVLWGGSSSNGHLHKHERTSPGLKELWDTLRTPNLAASAQDWRETLTAATKLAKSMIAEGTANFIV